MKTVLEVAEALRDDLRFNTEFAVAAINQIGDAGKAARQIRDLGRFQALSNLTDKLTHLTKE